MRRWYVMRNATNHYCFVLCVMSFLCIPASHMIFFWFTSPFLLLPLLFLLSHIFCMTFDVKIMNSSYLTCLHIFLLCQYLPPIYVPVFISCQPIFAEHSPGDFIFFFGLFFLLLMNELDVFDSPWCPTFLHYTPHLPIWPTHVLVVAPPSLPCSPPQSCLDNPHLTGFAPL